MADLEDPGIFKERTQPVDGPVKRKLALTRLAPLGTLSRSAGEGGPSPQGWVGEGVAKGKGGGCVSRTAMPQRDVGGEAGGQRECDAGKRGPGAGDRTRLRPDRDHSRLVRCLDPVIQTLDCGDERIGAGRREGRDLRNHRLGPLGRRHRGNAGEPLRHPRCQRAELHFAQKRHQPLRIERLDRKRRERAGEGHVVVELDQLLRQTRLLLVLDQRLAAFRLFYFGRAGEQCFEIAISVDQLGRGLDPDAGDTGNVVNAVAAQRLDVDHALRPDPEPLTDLGDADRPILDRIEHRDLVVHELHQILVGGDDGDLGAGLDGVAGVGGNQVVGLEIRELDLADAKCVGGSPDQSKLGDEIGGRLRALRLVLVVEAIAERDAGGVEDDGNMIGVGLAQQLRQHVAEAEHRTGRGPVRARQRRQGVIGAKDETRTVDQKNMMRRRRTGRCGGGRGQLRNERFDDFVHGILHLDVARCCWVRWRDGFTGTGGLHRAIDKEPGAIGALDLSGRGEIEIHPRMAERPFAAVANGDRPVDVDGFERPHMRSGNSRGRERPAERLTGTMIRFAARQSITPSSRTERRARGSNETL